MTYKFFQKYRSNYGSGWGIWCTVCPLCRRLAPIGDGPNAEYGPHKGLRAIPVKKTYRYETWDCPAEGYGWLDLKRLMET